MKKKTLVDDSTSNATREVQSHEAIERRGFFTLAAENKIRILFFSGPFFPDAREIRAEKKKETKIYHAHAGSDRVHISMKATLFFAHYTAYG